MIELDNVRFEANPKNVSTLELWKTEDGRWQYCVFTPEGTDKTTTGLGTTHGYKYRGVAIRNAVTSLEELLARHPHE